MSDTPIVSKPLAFPHRPVNRRKMPAAAGCCARGRSRLKLGRSAMLRGTGIMIRKAIGICVFATTFVAALTYAQAATKFDGTWSVVIYTKSGPCDPSYRISGQIVDGQIYYAYG